MKKTSRMLLALMLVFSVSFLFGCNSASPSDTVESYLKELQEGDVDDLSEVMGLSGEDDEEAADNSEELDNKLIEAMNKIEYTINSENIEGDSATVNVTINGPDFSLIMDEVMNEAVEIMFSDEMLANEPTDKELTELVNDLFIKAIDDVEYTERTSDVALTKSDGEWEFVDEDGFVGFIINLDEEFLDSLDEEEVSDDEE